MELKQGPAASGREFYGASNCTNMELKLINPEKPYQHSTFF